MKANKDDENSNFIGEYERPFTLDDDFYVVRNDFHRHGIDNSGNT